MYKEDIQYKSSDFTRGDIGRTDFCVVIEQVYGYMAFNNLPYGCVTFLDVTYFLSRPKSRTLLISDPIFNNSRNPTLLQTIYYFVELVLVGHYTKKKLKPSLMATESISEILEENIDESMKEESDDEFSLLSDSNNESDYSDNNNRTKYKLDIDSLRAGNVIGSGATCQVIKLKNRNIVVKNCDIRNATE